MELVQDLESLVRVAAGKSGNRSIIAYPLGNTTKGRELSYHELLLVAERNAHLISQIQGFKSKTIVLLHLSDHLDNIIWLWSVVLAGGVPAMSTPFTNLPAQRKKHIEHLHHLFDRPICITRRNLFDQFSDQEVLKPYTIESLTSTTPRSANGFQHGQSTISLPPQPEDLALLMLTSGSTGYPKAVCLTHGQLLCSVAGKVAARQIPEGLPFLNWIGFDQYVLPFVASLHRAGRWIVLTSSCCSVASVTEIHLHALYHGASQVHVQAADVISRPTTFLNLINRHRVGRSFAPNFFLAKLREVLESENRIYDDLDESMDLSCLRFLVSGGEANVTELCKSVAKILVGYGAPPDVIAPGFGMTETCAGSIYNLKCPEYDLQNGYQFASLGHSVPGIEMRIVNDVGGKAQAVAMNEPGALEVRGPIVFKGYYNNIAATSEAFASGWFRTGDQAMIDTSGHLVLVGRVSETMIINGIKHSPIELETSLEEASIIGMTPSYTVCFSFRPPSSQTEQICVVYLPSFSPNDTEARIVARNAIVKVTLLQTGSRPDVLPLNNCFLQKSTLGKLSRSKIRASFCRGDYTTCQDIDYTALKAYYSAQLIAPQNATESILIEEFCDVLDFSPEKLSTDTPIFEMGVTSIHLIRLKKRLEHRLSITDIPLLALMTNPNVRSLANALETLKTPKKYEPIVTLQQGSKTPIWLFHPGIGEVLVFLGLAKFLPEYPVYALRARGFEPNESYFENITEAVTIYHAAIKEKQPEGPYALAGYSYGTMLAFETAKVLEKNGDRVAFLGSFNLPPHIKVRMQQLDWINCLLHLCYFLNLITSEHAEIIRPHLQQNCSREQALSYIIKAADSVRMTDLAVNRKKLENWTDLSYGLQSMAREYEPSGSVEGIDVFFADPLKIVAASKLEWVEKHLGKWNNFSRSEPRFHEVGGEHYTMIGEEHVLGFQKTFRNALEKRGL